MVEAPKQPIKLEIPVRYTSFRFHDFVNKCLGQYGPQIVAFDNVANFITGNHSELVYAPLGAFAMAVLITEFQDHFISSDSSVKSEQV